MTNKYTQHKYEDISIEEGIVRTEFSSKKTPKRWQRTLDFKCPSAQHAKRKDEFMKWVYEKHGHHLISYPHGELESNIQISTQGKSSCDLDNLVKSVHDALSGIVFANDKQIKKISARLCEDTFMDSIRVIIKPIKY